MHGGTWKWTYRELRDGAHPFFELLRKIFYGLESVYMSVAGWILMLGAVSAVSLFFAWALFLTLTRKK